MKNKTLSLLTLSILSTLILISCVSAVSLDAIDNSSIVVPTNVAHDAGSFDITFDLTNTGNAGTLDWNASAITSSHTASITFNDSSIADGSNTSVTETITATVTFDSNQVGTIEGLIDVIGQGASTHRNFTFSVSIDTIPEPEEPPVDCGTLGDGSMDLTIEDITVLEGFGDDDEWLLLDEIEVEINVENNNDDEKIKDIQVEWGLYDEGANDWAIKLDDEPDFDVKSDDDKTITINFKINEKDLDVDFDELDGDYTLYVIATGEEQGDIDKDVCAIESEPVSIEIESDFVVLDDIEVLGTVSCGADLQITADVWNIGDDDQEEVLVLIKNNELGISKKIEIGDVDAFKDEVLDTIIKIPQDAESKAYDLDLLVFDEDNDLYENDYDDDPAQFKVRINVDGSCSVDATAAVSASLESGGKSGEDLVVKAIITNTADDMVTYLVNPAGYTEWASSAELDSEVIVLNAGESKEVLITFSVNKDTIGEQSFELEVLADGEIVIQQPVAVTVEGKKGFSLTGNIINSDNWHLWGIGFLNVVLVIIIIVVALRVARSK